MNQSFPTLDRKQHFQFFRLNATRHCRAFTMVDLLVVVGIIAFLAITLLPAIANTADRSKRANCQNNLRLIAVGVTAYAGNNNGQLFSSRNSAGVYVQNTLSPISAAAAGTIGLSMQTEPASPWTCPNRPSLPIYEPAFNQWIIGYQYFGGMRNWHNPAFAGGIASHSPTNLATAKPHWALAADAVMKVNGQWGGAVPGREIVYANMPPHHSGDSLRPQGGNQAFVDGSVQWIQAEEMFFLSSWSPADRQAYWYQDPKDFSPALQNALPLLRFTP
jgi:type II secretory pathway pseudopilin PulG